jgi:hypothetical protein
MKVIQAPNSYDDANHPTIFLAGSIEMGAAEDWQAKMIAGLKSTTGTILNPRRDDWDSSWEQTMEDAKFREQVVWELNALEQADFIALYLSPGTKSPISLLELGLFCNQQMIVCCPDGFWRKGNVDIVCDRFQIHQVDTLKEMIKELKKHMDAMRKIVWQRGLGGQPE